MAGTLHQDAAESFSPLRPKLIRIAYRMLGSVAEAEDVVQDAFVRWMAVDQSTVRDAEAFLRRIVTRLSLDVLKSARRQRETYVGPWLPEPVVGPELDEVDDVTLPLMMALERLTPLERAAFLLHDVFGIGFDEVARTIGRDPAACRQLASRARAHVRAERPRFEVTRERGFEIAQAFFAASREGDMGRLRTLLADDVTACSDGGGKRSAAAVPIVGIEDVVRVHAGLADFFARDNNMSKLVRYDVINGLPGFLTIESDGTVQTTALEIVDGKVVGIYIVRNPDKLRHLNGGKLH
ncbi:sigma-70 family RNA polymerase sigma factor [Pelagibacterium sp. 26DY04]|uniref:sigma-70 family RNA polymerase sigma factor n=1 Tax=Pelagibacterium sp. 26DY04 TaxID=2967130 RepID=UPI002816175E|nr:sigma-70 family RNA polymerase sigma factor [Pelagibacterium sp. 26DY04]WMT88735.1 sigma-70 family RNA polymerase sigma factor [Pelagibacterium sp. 26DY04]